MGIINLAHGQLMMLAMYITYVLFHYLGIDPYITLFISMPSLFLVGVLIQKFLLNPLMKVETILPENQVLMTVGIGMVLTEIIRFIFSSNYLSVKTSYATEAIFIGRISFSVALTVALFSLSADLGALLVSHQDRPGALHSSGCARW
jgi:branched-chain amino acid transport system permease protein